MSNEDLLGKISDFLNKSTRSIKDRLTLDITDLIRAVDDNNPEEVARALRAGVDPNKDDGLQRYPLLLAADSNKTLIVGLLLKSGANSSLTDNKGETALYKAVTWENRQMVELLLQTGANSRQANEDGRTPYQEAEEKGYATILELLDAHKDQAKATRVARDKAKHEELKAEAQAARKQKKEEETQEENEARRKAAMAAERDKAKAARRLRREYPQLKAGDALGALIAATQAGDIAGAELLLSQVEDLNAVDPTSGTTPLMAALKQKNGRITSALIRAGADTTTVPPKHQHSPLTWVVLNGHDKLVELMIAENKADLAAILNNQDQLLSPQFLAYKDAKIMNLLLEAGADPFFGGSGVASPIIKAIDKASIAILPVLVRHKADLNKLVDGRRPLEWAIHFNRMSWLVGLLEEGANIDLPNEEGRTPLMQAVLVKAPDMIKLLVDKDADLTLRDKEGQTAMDLAGEDEDIMEILR